MNSRSDPIPHPINIAHRGARSLAPENTMPAIVKAWELGAHGIETDVRITRDARLILHHDPTFGRTTDIEARFPERTNDPVESFSFEETQQLDAGTWFVERDPFNEIAAGSVTDTEQRAMRGLRVPGLEEAIAFVTAHAWFINIELKRSGDSRLIGLVLDLLDRSEIAPHQFSLSSFDHDMLRTIQRLRPDTEINALIGESGQKPQDWGTYEFSVYNANADLTDEHQVRNALARNCRVNLYTVNDPLQMRRFLDCGVDAIITDYPQRLRRLLPR